METGASGEETLREDVAEERLKLQRVIAWCRVWVELIWLHLWEQAWRMRIRTEESWSPRPLEGWTLEGFRLGLTSLGVCMALTFELNDSDIVLLGMAAILIISDITTAAVEDQGGGRREVGGNELVET